MNHRTFSTSVPLRTSRAAAHLELAEALDALPRQTELDWPVKIALSRDSGARLMAELVGDHYRSRGASSSSLQRVLDRGQAWLATATAGDGRGKSGNADRTGEVRESLDALGWHASESRHGVWTIQERSGLTPGGRGFIGVGNNGFVCLAQPPALLCVRGDGCGLALAALALEANERLRLARTSIEPLATSGALRACWQAVVPIDRGLDRMLEEALAATWVARESTLPAYRALTTPALARAYLEGFDRPDWRSVDTTTAAGAATAPPPATAIL